MYECTYRLNFQFQMSKKETVNMRIRNGIEELFCLRSNLSNGKIVSA